MTSVEISGLAKVHPGGVCALDGVDLEVADGELLVVAGPSGGGKTTLLRLVAGLDRPSRGTVRLGGRDVTRLAPGRRDVSMVFQEFALYPHMSVRRNIAFALRVRRLPRAEIDRRVAEAAALTGIAPLLDRAPGTLSGGERQRVALARVIARRAACTLFDEPLASVDAALRRRLRGELRGLQHRLGLTVLYVTHDQAEAMTLADRLAVLEGGRLRQAGAPRELYDRPADRFVAEFLGDPPMNTLEGRIAHPADSLRFETSGGLAIALDRRAVPAGPCTLGVRPEHLSLVAAGHPGSLPAVVESVEFVGAATHVTARTPAGDLLTASVTTDPAPREGEPIHVLPRPDRVHIFGVDGRRISS